MMDSYNNAKKKRNLKDHCGANGSLALSHPLLVRSLWLTYNDP